MAHWVYTNASYEVEFLVFFYNTNNENLWFIYPPTNSRYSHVFNHSLYLHLNVILLCKVGAFTPYMSSNYIFIYLYFCKLWEQMGRSIIARAYLCMSLSKIPVQIAITATTTNNRDNFSWQNEEPPKFRYWIIRCL